jgi:hypothetical protein
MNNFVNYKTHVLAKNSQAYELWQLAQKSGEYKPLDQHLKLVAQQHKQLLERYP